MHRSRSASARRSAPIRSRAAASTSVALAVALAVTATGCAAAEPADPASDALTAALQEWQALDETARRDAAEADARKLGAFLIAASGLPATTGVTAEEIEARIPRLPQFELPAATPPADETPAAPTLPDDPGDIDLGDIDLGEFGLDGVDLGDIDVDDLEERVQGGLDADLSSLTRTDGATTRTASLASAASAASTASTATSAYAASTGTATTAIATSAASTASAASVPRAAVVVDVKGAAINQLNDMVDGLQGVLKGARNGGYTQSYDDSDSSDGSTFVMDFADGKLTNSASSRRSFVLDNVATTIDSASNIDIDVCPNADGEVEGFFTVDGGITVPGADGKPVKTQMSVLVEIKATVDDDAWAVDSVGSFNGVLRTGAPNADPGGFDEVTSTKKYAGTMTINYGNDEGSAHAVRARTSQVTGDASLGDLTTAIVSKLQQKALEEAEKHWRDGGCVRADVDEDPEKIERAGYSLLTVDAVSVRKGAAPIANAVAEYTGENLGDVGGKVGPAGQHDAPADFDFRAEDKDGVSLPRFKVTSRQGIGYGVAYIEVGQNGWVIEGDVNETETYAVKCDGLVGQWDVTTTGGFGYEATSHFTIGEDLSGTFSAAGYVAGVGNFTDGGRVWFEARNGGYVFNIDGGNEATMSVRKATDAECAL